MNKEALEMFGESLKKVWNDEQYFQTLPFAWRRLLIQIVYFSLAGFMIFWDFKILIDGGFLHQNLIYLILAR